MLLSLGHATAAAGNKAIVAAGREALALAGDRVEEFVFAARHLNARSAAAAVFVEGVSRIAGSLNCSAVAHAIAGAWVPVVAFGALFVEASASALFGVPILAFEEASLWGAFPLAGVSVEDSVRVLFPVSVLEDRSALASAVIEVEVLRRGALSAAIALAIASVPVEEGGNAVNGAARGPFRSADALTTGVIVEEMFIAVVGCMGALARMVIPSVSSRAGRSKASAAANSEGVVEVVADGARGLLADAFAAVPELTAFALSGLGNPCAVYFIPVLTGKVVASGQADALMAPVVVVLVCTAVKRQEAALAPRLFPVEARRAILWVTLAGTLVAVEVETDWAGLGRAEAVATSFVPEEAWQTAGVHLDTTARAGVPSPVDVSASVKWVGTVSSVSGTIDWHALASTGPFVPVPNSGKRELAVSHIEGVAILSWASAFASGLVPLLAEAKAVFGLDAHTCAVAVRPEGVCGAIKWHAYAGASLLLPDSAWRAHHWAALAGAGVVVPNHHVWAVVGTAKAGALRVIPEIVSRAGFSGDADPSAILSAEVGMHSVGSSC